MDIKWTESWVCEACAVAIANGEGTDEHFAAMDDTAHWAVGQEDTEFATWECECCRTSLAGRRVQAWWGEGGG